MNNGKEEEIGKRGTSDLSVLFQSWFNGPRFTVGCNYFCKHGKQRLSLFDRHCQRLYVTVHAKRVIFAHLTEIVFLISFESLDIATSNSTSGGFVSISVIKLRHL